MAETVEIATPPAERATVAPPASPQSELISLLDAVKEQTVALRIEHVRAASEAKREYDTLTTRMTTLAPQIVKAVQERDANERTIARLGQSEAELKRDLADTRRELARYKPLAEKLEDELLEERNRLGQAGRDMAELEGKYAIAGRKIEDLFQRVANAEIEMQRTLESNAAYELKGQESEFALAAATRDLAQLQSEVAASHSDVERLSTEIAELNAKLGAERDAASRAQTALDTIRSDFDQYRKSSESAVKDFEGRERRIHEIIAQRDWQIYDFETRMAAAQSKIEFLSKRNEGQRDDILRHIAHIGKLEGTNRHLLDTLSRNAISIDDTAQEAERGKKSAPRLRAVSED